MAPEVWWFAGKRTKENEAIRRGEQQTEAHIRQPEPGSRSIKRCCRKKTLTPDDKHCVAEHMIKEHKISQRQAFKEVGLAQSAARYKRRTKKDEPLINELQELVEKHPSIGFWQCYYMIRRTGLI